MKILSCESINKFYRSGFAQIKKKHVLNDISFEVSKNEVFGIIGPNGAGKSTLLKIILGFVSQDSGTILLSGKNPSSSLTHKDLGYLPENPSLYPHLTPREHLQFACRLEKITGTRANDKITSVLETVALSESIDTPIKKQK